jgi:hypothetical protein
MCVLYKGHTFLKCLLMALVGHLFGTRVAVFDEIVNRVVILTVHYSVSRAISIETGQ